jgi:hypothetical protein
MRPPQSRWYVPSSAAPEVHGRGPTVANDRHNVRLAGDCEQDAAWPALSLCQFYNGIYVTRIRLTDVFYIDVTI